MQFYQRRSPTGTTVLITEHAICSDFNSSSLKPNKLYQDKKVALIHLPGNSFDFQPSKMKTL